jgi:hypothetical protein
MNGPVFLASAFGRCNGVNNLNPHLIPVEESHDDVPGHLLYYFDGRFPRAVILTSNDTFAIISSVMITTLQKPNERRVLPDRHILPVCDIDDQGEKHKTVQPGPLGTRAKPNRRGHV